MPTFLFVHQVAGATQDIKCSFRCYNQTNIVKFSEGLISIDWPRLWPGDLDEKVSYFVNELDQLYCSSFPVMTKRVTSKRVGKPWLTPELIKMIKLKSLYFKLSKVGVITGEFNNQYRIHGVRTWVALIDL